MVNQELLDYVQKELSKGFSYDQIKAILIQYKYPENMINETFSYMQQNQKIAEMQKQEQHTPPMMDIQSAAAKGNGQNINGNINGQNIGQNVPKAEVKTTAAAPTLNAELSKTQKATVHYVSVLSGLVILIVLIQLFTSQFSASNIIKFIIFIFIAVMTIVYAKLHYAKPKFTLMYRIFLGLDILICLGLIFALFLT